jgi:hypothetical protein
LLHWKLIYVKRLPCSKPCLLHPFCPCNRTITFPNTTLLVLEFIPLFVHLGDELLVSHDLSGVTPLYVDYMYISMFCIICITKHWPLLSRTCNVMLLRHLYPSSPPLCRPLPA